LPWFKLVLIDNKISFCYNVKCSIDTIENGWFFQRASAKVDTFRVKDIFDKEYSALHYYIPLNRSHKYGLFFKMFIGMYVAFLVAFIAMFIPVHMVEPRFGLPVGGLFAAIGNKYIIEGLLPPSSEFTLIDYLHSTSIISILLILAYSAVLLYLTENKKSHELIKHKPVKKLHHLFNISYGFDFKSIDIKMFNKVIIVLLFLSYMLINIWYIKCGWV
jgi:hypothetical protein